MPFGGAGREGQLMAARSHWKKRTVDFSLGRKLPVKSPAALRVLLPAQRNQSRSQPFAAEKM